MPSSGEAVPLAAQTASPLTLLPDPLLRLIFRNVLSGSRAFPTGKLAWTHTCRRLRNVALAPEAKDVWGANVTAIPEALNVFLERARDAPLCVDLEPDDWDGWKDKSQTLLDLVSEHTAHIERISVVLPSFSQLDHDTAARDAKAASCTSFHAALLDALAGKELPLLKHLDLSYAPYASSPSAPLSSAKPFTAPNLTTLRLSRQRISADHLYAILRSSLDLQSLSISWTPTDSPTLIQLPLKDAGAPLHMPNLTDLSLSAHDLPSVLGVWKVLIPCRNVRASFEASTSDAREFGSALTALSPLFYRAGLHNLALHTTADAFTFRMLPKRNLDTSPSLSVTTTTRASNPTTTPSELLDMFLRFIDSTWLDSLHLDVISLSKPAVSILSGFDTIVEMSCPFSSRSILYQLASAEVADEDPILPSMGTLTLTSPSSSQQSDASEAGPGPEETREKWDVVQRFLKSRAEKSAEVDCVRLMGRAVAERRGRGVNGSSSAGKKSAREEDEDGLRAVRGLVSEVVDGRK
ncbi:unnamed protein product [Peniophora sp. CBMAI 1063]|nr:unnamed protein product [Peniophora sp. CBMAI 1063]